MSSILKTAQIRLKNLNGTYQSVVDILSSIPTSELILLYMLPYYSQIINNTPTGAEKIINSISLNHDKNTTYNINDYCIHDGELYKCNTNNTTGTWNSTSNNWDKIYISNLLTSIYETLSDDLNDINELKSYKASLVNANALTKIQSITLISNKANANEQNITNHNGRITNLETSKDNFDTRIANILNNYPENYIINLADAVCEKVRKVQTADTLTFVNVYNLRYKDINYRKKQLENMKKAIEEISSQLHIDFYCCYGNLADDYYLNSSNHGKKEMIEATKYLNKAFKNNLQFRIVGSEDVKKKSSDHRTFLDTAISIFELNSIIGNYNDKLILYRISDDYLQGKIGYYDFLKQKIRLITFNTSWYKSNDASGTAAYLTEISSKKSKLTTPQLKEIAAMMNIRSTRNITSEEAKNWKILFLSGLSLDESTSDSNYNNYSTRFFNGYYNKEQFKLDPRDLATDINFSTSSDYVSDILCLIHGNTDFSYDNLCGITRIKSVSPNYNYKQYIFPCLNLGISSLVNTTGIELPTNDTTLILPIDKTISFPIITLDVNKEILYYHTYGVGPDAIIHYKPTTFTTPVTLTSSLNLATGETLTWSCNRNTTQNISNNHEQATVNYGAGNVTPSISDAKKADISGVQLGFFFVKAEKTSEQGLTDKTIELWNMAYEPPLLLLLTPSSET